MFLIGSICREGLRLPRIDLRGGQMAEILLPVNWEGRYTLLLTKALKEQVSSQTTDVAILGDTPALVAPGDGNSFREVLLDKALLPQSAISAIEDRFDVCLDVPVGMLPWTVRRVLALELALVRRPAILVVDDLGFDPMGRRKFGEYACSRVAQMGCAGLALRYPIFSYDGKPRSPLHPDRWSKVQYHAELVGAPSVP